MVRKKSREAVLGEASPLRFPAENVDYFTVLKFVTYNRRNPKHRAIRVDQADIVLPLPVNLREYYTMQYAGVEFDKIGGAMSYIDRVMDKYMEGADLLKSLADTGFAERAIELAQALSRKTASYISDDLGGVIDRVTGTVVNPHITSVFKGVSLRDHPLQWRLHPRNASESREIRKIINFVRAHMHPTKKDDFLLNFPDEVYVSFHAKDKEFLFPIFKAVVIGMECPQSSDGSNAFYAETDEPAFYDLTIHLQEVESATREDFEDSVASEGDMTPTPPPADGSDGFGDPR